MDPKLSCRRRWMVYSAGVKYGEESDWGFAWSRYLNTQVPSEKNLWMRALAGATDPYILQRYYRKVTYTVPYILHNHCKMPTRIFFPFSLVYLVPLVQSRYLTASLDRSMIRPQDVTSVLSGVAHNPAGSQMAWRHLQMNWKFLVDQFGVGSFIMGSIIESTTSHFSTEFDYDQARFFLYLFFFSSSGGGPSKTHCVPIMARRTGQGLLQAETQ